MTFWGKSNIFSVDAASPVFCRFLAGHELHWLSSVHPPDWLYCAYTSYLFLAEIWLVCGSHSGPVAFYDKLQQLIPAYLPCLQYSLKYKQELEEWVCFFRRLKKAEFYFHAHWSYFQGEMQGAVKSYCFILQCIINANLNFAKIAYENWNHHRV